MKEQTTFAAIDIGTAKTCTCIGDVGKAGSPRIVGIGTTPTRGLHKGLVVNVNDARETIRESVTEAEKASNYRVESACIGISGGHVSSINNRGVISITHNDHLIRADDLKRACQSARSVMIYGNSKLLHVIPRNYFVDLQGPVRNPLGMYGFKLEVDAHIITAAVSSVQTLVKCVSSVGICIDDLILESLAASEAVLSENEKQTGVILADIGSGTTDIAVFKDGSIWHTSVLPIAGYQITRDVAIGLGLPFDVAEKMKIIHGKVTPYYQGEEADASTVSDNGHNVPYQDLCDIIHARVEEILESILLAIPRSSDETIISTGLVLTGGSSNLSGIEALGRETLHIPVRVGVPHHVDGVTKSIHDPAYVTSIGLLLWGINHRYTRSWKKLRFLRRLFGRIGSVGN